MNKKVKFRKGRIILAIIICLILLVCAILIASYPEVIIRNSWMMAKVIQIMGILSIPFYLGLLYSFIRIIPRKFAVVISEEFLIDNSKFEALGEIAWGDISKVQKKEKRSIEILLNESVFKRKELNSVKKFLLFMQNWNSNQSILISSALLECSIEELEEMISDAYKKYKLK